jgi:hypothetical protein
MNVLWRLSPMAARHSVNPWTKPDLPPTPATASSPQATLAPTPAPAPSAATVAVGEAAVGTEARSRPATPKPRNRDVEPEPARPARLQIRTTARTEALVLAEIRRRIEAGERGRGIADKTTVLEEAIERTYGHLLPRKREAPSGQ